MTGLSLEHRYQLVQAAERIAIASTGLTPADARVLRVLAFDFHNGRTSRCDPGYRAIARRARCALSTVAASVRRLAAAGFLTVQKRWVRAAGRWLRWTSQMDLAAAVPAPRSGAATQPISSGLRGVMRPGDKVAKPRSVAAQLAYLKRWAAEFETKQVFP